MGGAGLKVNLGQERTAARSRRILRLLLVLGALVVPLAKAGIAWAVVPGAPAPGQITEFQLPAGSDPDGITTGPEGDLWFADSGTSKIGRITPSGQITEFPLPATSSHPTSITAGPESSLWFTEESGEEKIGRITPSGHVTGFAVPSGEEPRQITAGPDGNLWFTQTGIERRGSIAKITPSGQITEYPLPVESRPMGIVAGEDGNLWFTQSDSTIDPEAGPFKIGRITPNGEIVYFPVHQEPYGITAGPEGNLWFTEIFGQCFDEEEMGSKVARITPSGQITEFPLLHEFSHPYSITTGPDGNLWFLALSGPDCRGYDAGFEPNAVAAEIGSISPRGMHHVTEFLTESLPLIPETLVGEITAGPDGHLWFTEPRTDRIGRITPGPPGRFTIEVANYHTTARQGWVKLKLACVGGGIESPCRGTLDVSIGPLGPRVKKLVLDHRFYTVPSETTRQIRLRLAHRALSLLAHHPQLRMVASVTRSGSERTSDETFLPHSRQLR